MPLSKVRNAERMRQIRLHAQKQTGIVQPEIPIYNPSKHKAGDTVRVNGKVVKIPELDADGNPIPEV